MLQSLRVAFFLASRQLRRSGKGTTLLIIFIMTLTFLNLVFVSGVLLGLVEGARSAYKDQYSGDVLISELPTKNYIENSQRIVRTLEQYDDVAAISPRYGRSGRLIADFQKKTKGGDKPDEVGTLVIGIDPVREQSVTNLESLLIAGEYLTPSDNNVILVGSQLLEEYAGTTAPGEGTISGVGVGDKVRVEVGDTIIEPTVKGILKSKVGAVGQRIYFVDRELRPLINRTDGNLFEIAAALEPGASNVAVVEALKSAGYDRDALVQTYEESQGKFFDDISVTFGVLGNVIGSIGLAVASITIFIVIFINAVTRRRYIGIMKGIGIDRRVILFSYVMQSLFYTVIGSAIGVAILFGLLKPYIAENPINFPFSDGILVAEPESVALRIIVTLVITIIAGYVPARIIVQKNTLDSILGRE